MTIKEIRSKYLFHVCDPGNGPVLVCAIEIEKTPSYHLYPYVINFISCANNREEYDFVDNVFVCHNNIKTDWRYNSSGKLDVLDFNSSYAHNFIKRLFSPKHDDFIKKVLKNDTY